MHRCLWCFVSVCIILATSANLTQDSKVGDTYTEEDGVLVLTPQNIDAALRDLPTLLLEFYKPSCPHCVAFAAEYASTANLVRQQKMNLQVAKINTAEAPDMKQKYEIQGVPTVMLFHDGNRIIYSGPRIAKAIVTWLKKVTEMPVMQLKSLDQVLLLQADHEAIVLGAFSDADSALARLFKVASSAVIDVPFAAVSDKFVMRQLNLADNSIAIYRRYEHEPVELSANIRDAMDLVRWTKTHSLPTVTNVSHQSLVQKIKESDIKTFAYLFGTEVISATPLFQSKAYASFYEAAKFFVGEVLFLYYDVANPLAARPMNLFGITSDDQPALRVIKSNADQTISKYQPDFSAFTTVNIVKFVQNVMLGKISPYLKKQPLPTDWDKDVVKVLTAENINNFIKNSNKNILLEFYAPWCAHCKKLEPIWNELGMHYKNSAKIHIAKIDATANELPEFSVNGYPTIKLYKYSTKEWLDFGGDRTFDTLKNFVETEGSKGQKDEGTKFEL